MDSDNGGNSFDFTSSTFDFIDSLNAEGQVGQQWEPLAYRSTAASSSGDEFPMYYSSSEPEGELEHGYSIYSDQNYYNIESDVDMSNYSNMSLPILRIPSPSPPGSPARSPSLNNLNEIHTGSLSKRPRSPVAADLDTANILPMEHRRKRIKPARVRQ